MQNAWQTEHPEEIVEDIYLEIPDGAGVDNPAKDAALIGRIGAKRILEYVWAAKRSDRDAVHVPVEQQMWSLSALDFLTPKKRMNQRTNELTKHKHAH